MKHKHPPEKIAAMQHHHLEIFLQAGDFYWGDSSVRIKTILGSCVAICMWHPELSIGGMSHSLLPKNPERNRLNPKYLDDAVEMFRREMHKTGTYPTDYVVKVFGGAKMFDNDAMANVGKSNVAMVTEILTRNGFGIRAKDLGGEIHRNLLFDLWSGDAWLKKIKENGS